MTSVVLNGVTYTDDANGSTGMANGGHRTRFVPCLANFVIEAATQLSLQHDSRDAADASEAAALASEIAAAASALSAVNAPGTTATSTTSDTIALGSTTLTIQTGKAFVVGQFVTIAYTTDPTNWMHGVITAYNSGTGSITVNVTASAGGGTYALWTVALSGPNKSALFYSARTSNTALAITDNNTLIDITSGTFSQTFAAAATLGNGWSCYVRNSGSGVITLDPNGAETIDGAATFTLSSGSVVMLQCDGATLRKTSLTQYENQYFHARDQKASGTDGGTSSTGQNIRTLNTTVANTITGASLASNLVTLPAGTYEVFGMGVTGNQAAGYRKLSIYNNTDSVDILVGPSTGSGSSVTDMRADVVRGRFTLAATKNIALRHYISYGFATYGFGFAASSGQVEVYAEIFISKVV